MGLEEEVMRTSTALLVTGVLGSITARPASDSHEGEGQVIAPDFYQGFLLLGDGSARPGHFYQVPIKRGFDAMRGLTFGKEKRNFDEIDRAGFGRFVKRSSGEKRNFDEIDRAGFGRFVKRNFDEIDRAGFGRFVKKNF